MHFITFSFSLSLLSLSLPLYLSFHLSHLIYQRWRDTIISTSNCWIMNHYSSSTSPASIPLFPSGPDYVIYFFQMDTICTTRTAPGLDAPKQRKSSELGNRSHAIHQQLDTISASDCTILFM